MRSFPETYDCFCEKNLDQIFRPPANEGFFFYINVHGILCLKMIAVVNEGAIVLDICTTLKGSPDFAAGTARAFHKLLRNFLHSEQFLMLSSNSEISQQLLMFKLTFLPYFTMLVGNL